jgi:hypothetical protein
MVYKVSVLRGTKNKPELVRVTEVVADGYQVGESDDLFGRSDDISFYNNNIHLFRSDTQTLVASFPSNENWVIEQV